MKRREKSAPIWLFSFVDLAFLLLILFTQLIPDTPPNPVAVAELELPRIERVEPAAVAPSSEPVWQVRIRPLAIGDDPAIRRAPFELIEPARGTEGPARAASTADAAEIASREPFDARDLEARLELLHARSAPRPLLAPHREARSEDLLVAVSLLERIWQGGRGVTVLPTPAISAPPPTSESAPR
jgi:hypothetical protein